MPGTCTSCGAVLASEDRFCTTCGTPVPETSVAEAPVAEAPVAEPPTAEPPTAEAPVAGSPTPGSPTAEPPTAEPPTAEPPTAGSPTEPTTPAPFPPGTFTEVPPVGARSQPPTLSGQDVNSIRLAPSEVVKKVYDLGRRQRPLGWLESQLVVTDTRVLYRSRAKSLLGESVSTSETQISDVSGIGVTTRRGLTPLNLTALVLGLVGGLVVLLSARAIAPAVALLVVVVALAVVRLVSTEVDLVIHVRGDGASPISLSRAGRRASLWSGALAAVAGPVVLFFQTVGLLDASEAGFAADPATAQSLSDELGALVLELQNAEPAATD